MTKGTVVSLCGFWLLIRHLQNLLMHPMPHKRSKQVFAHSFPFLTQLHEDCTWEDFQLPGEAFQRVTSGIFCLLNVFVGNWGRVQTALLTLY